MLSNAKQCYARLMISNANAIVELHSLFEQKAHQMGDNNNKRETTKTGSQSCRGLWPAAKNQNNILVTIVKIQIIIFEQKIIKNGYSVLVDLRRSTRAFTQLGKSSAVQEFSQLSKHRHSVAASTCRTLASGRKKLDGNYQNCQILSFSKLNIYRCVQPKPLLIT